MFVDAAKRGAPRCEDERIHDGHGCVVQVREVGLGKNALSTRWVAPAVTGRSADDVDDLHALPAGGTGEPRRRCLIRERVVGLLRRCDVQQCPGLDEIGTALAVGEQAKVSYAMEAVR